MTIRYSRLFLAIIMSLSLGNLYAYKCTFKNRTTRAEITIQFKTVACRSSQEYRLYPGETVKWDSRLCLIKGLSVKSMKYFRDGKITPGGGLVVPTSDKASDTFVIGRAKAVSWEMYETKYPIDENKSKIQFTLKRYGVTAGAAEPYRWESPQIEIIEGLKKVEVIS